MKSNNETKPYYSNIRHNLIELIPPNPENNVLEVGAGDGSNLLHIKAKKLAKFIVGIDIAKFDNSNQTSPLMDRFIIGNIENQHFDFPPDFFDVILFGDVLEHLIDPGSVINKLRKYLSPNGVVIASIPNIRAYSILRQIIIQGDFKYSDSGILDKTHLRFFCKKNAIELFKRNGLYPVQVIANLRKKKCATVTFNNITFGLFEEFLALQYFIVAQKKSNY